MEEAVEEGRRTMMSYRGFGKGSGPSVPPQSKPTFGSNSFPRPPSSSTPPGTATFLVPPQLQPLRPRFIESSGRSDGQKLLYRDLDALPPERPSAVTTFASHDSTAGVSARVSRYPSPEMIRSPSVVYVEDEVSRKSSQTLLRSPATASATSDNLTSVPDNYYDLSQHHVQSSVSPYFGPHNPQQSLTKELNSVQVLKRPRSPPSPSANKFLQENLNVARKDFRRPSISPPISANSLNFQSAGLQPQVHQKPLPSTTSEATVSMPASSTASKRTRSPPLRFSADETLEGNYISSEDNAEREMLAKAKRLARFKVELSKSEQNSSDVTGHAYRHGQSILEQKHVGGHSMELTHNFANGHNFSDHEGSETSSIIIGLCPDMCPDSERAERERKGDLDQYERLDGDRNVTSRFLAVKKYNRTAEREASLIRPMPILWKTIDYLLNLLEQPYDERFLGVYNFLWDRMRAIRMDLRMQHIFNQGAIAMLEKMIRLHIIAMYELCEYTKGEGFSEGFDAHLNIEQMNKTSVELFQMYDDHRKKGIDVPTEREFRGYYALLKLDKHPGYKVEPAELSLDLAQMTPEIRQTPEVLFARNVARACRTGNFIAFFRLARKASYLQACLMHAHFVKLRTQALASLHSGLQNNQGLPVSHVADWLAMEDEDIEGLLEYHGFSLKAFEEPYMVKEGPFLNVDNEYPTKCSKLVHKKRSASIVKDVSPSIQVASLPVQTPKEIQRRKTYKHEPLQVSSVQNGSSVQKVDEEMPDSEAIVLPNDVKSGLGFKDTSISIQHSEKDYRTASPHPPPFGFSFSSNKPALQPTGSVISMSPNSLQLSRSVISVSPNSDANSRCSPKRKLNSAVDERPLESVTRPAQPGISLGYSFSFSAPISSFPIIPEDESLVIPQENEGDIDEDIENYQDKEVAEAKLKLFLRLWRRRASKLRMLREQRQLAANAALDSLSLGLPIRHYIDQPGNLVVFDINKAMRHRYDKQGKSWARLNVSEIVAGKLSRRNSDAKCLWWKIILCSQMNSQYNMGAAGSWLISKLMPSSDDDVVASSGLAIWKKWVPSQPGADPSCCISVIRDTTFGSLDETVSGASAVLFLVSESISWELQKAHLHKILMSIPSGAHLPLLILCGSCQEGVSSVIINALGLKDIDNSRVSGFLLVFLIENQHTEDLGGFFSDKRLREGLEWLAGESPLQLTLHCVKTRELLHTHLNSLSGGHDCINNPKLGPNDCISIFNAALDYSAEDIIGAANLNPTGWPGPEIALLDEFSDEDIAVKRYLPAMGWSSNAKVEPIIHAIQGCKLPVFPHDLSWLVKGSNAGHEIESHRIKLENSLIEYLTHTSKMMGESLATKEARVMLQTCARLQLYGSSYQIVPLWRAIFQRIFNWRLTSLSSGESFSAYISECHHTGPTSLVLDPGFEVGVPSSYYYSPSLDETIEVGCNSPLLVKGLPRSEALQHPPQIGSNGVEIHETVQESVVLDCGTNFSLTKSPGFNMVSPNGLNNDSREALISGKATKEADTLSKLLEQCNLLQGVIGEKLSVFF